MRWRLPPSARPSVMSGAIFEPGFEATTTPVAPASRGGLFFSMQAERSIVVDPKSPGGVNSPHGRILFDRRDVRSLSSSASILITRLLCLLGEGPGLCKIRNRSAHCARASAPVVDIIPRGIRDAIYDLVARNRYRWFGRCHTCILPNSDRS